MVVNAYNVHLVIMFVHALIHIVAFVVKINDLTAMVCKTFRLFSLESNRKSLRFVD